LCIKFKIVTQFSLQHRYSPNHMRGSEFYSYVGNAYITVSFH